MLPLPQRRAIEALHRIGLKQVACNRKTILCFQGHIPQVEQEVTMWVASDGRVSIGPDRARALLWCTEAELEGLARTAEKLRGEYCTKGGLVVY